jgi:hypothetical protein
MRILNLPRAAAVVAALALASPSTHAAPTVWNVNIGNEITPSSLSDLAILAMC